MLKVCGVTAGYGGRDIIRDISFSVEPGQFLCILGANGCGKTTLLKTILGILRPSSGHVYLNGDDLHLMNVKYLFQKIAYIPQAHMPPFPFTAREVVLMGRSPYLSYLGSPGAEDEKVANQVMEQMDIAWMADRSYTRLSGGERQLVIIARALAQQPRLLLMDEPTANLDFGNQYRVLEKMISLSEKGMGVVMVTHDPDHAFFCADHALLMLDGAILAGGDPRQVICEDAMTAIYNAPVKIVDIPISGGRDASVCVPIHTACMKRRPAGQTV